MATARGSFADIRTQAMTARSAAQGHSSKCRFPRSALQTSLYDVRKTTKISTTCTYYREILTVRALRSSRTIEYYVLLSLRTIEKRKDWIWIGFQSTCVFFTYHRELRTIECTYYREMTVTNPWMAKDRAKTPLFPWCLTQWQCQKMSGCFVSTAWSCVYLQRLPQNFKVRRLTFRNISKRTKTGVFQRTLTLFHRH